jgi:hypothetical protein
VALYSFTALSVFLPLESASFRPSLKSSTGKICNVPVSLNVLLKEPFVAEAIADSAFWDA